MLQVIGSARNLFLMPQDDPTRLEATCEMVIIVAERHYFPDNKGGVDSTPKIRELRVFGGITMLSALARNLIDACDDMVKLQQSVTIKTDDKSIVGVNKPTIGAEMPDLRVDSDIPESQLPVDIRDTFQPYETFSVTGEEYTATPKFVQYTPDDTMAKDIHTDDYTSADGSRWRIRTSNPMRGQSGDFYSVFYCRLRSA